jgi:uncharacterized protein YndB with AHSA1/START domain
MANLHPWPRQGNTVDFIQHVQVGAERVWQAFTTEDGLKQWLRVTDAGIPLEPGADFSFSWETRGRASGQTRHGYSGRVAKVVAPRLLALEWRLPFSKVTTYFSVQIQPSFALFGEDRGPECDIWIIHSGFPSEGTGLFEFDGHFRHWRQAIGDLAAWLEDRPGKPTPYALAGLQFVGGAPREGILVYDVIEGSPADQAGIRPGDIIRSVDGHPMAALDDFHDWIDERHPGESGVFALADRSVKVTVESVEDARNRFLIRRGEEWITRR